MYEIFYSSIFMQLFKYVTLTLCQQQHPADVVLPPRGKQGHLSKGLLIQEDGKKKQRI